MTLYTFFGQVLPSGTSAFTGSSTADIGLQFQATSNCILEGYWWYVPVGGSTTGSGYSFQLFTTTTGTSGSTVSNSSVTGTGTWTAGGWNYTALNSPISLVASTSYVAVVTMNPDGFQFLHGFWGTGAGSAGVTSGPVTAPSYASALGSAQQPYNIPSTGSFPTVTNSGGEWYGLDINVSNIIPGPPPINPNTVGGPYTEMIAYFPPVIFTSGDGHGGTAVTGWVGSGSSTAPNSAYIDDGSASWLVAPVPIYEVEFSQGRKWSSWGGKQWQGDYSIASPAVNTWGAFTTVPDNPTPVYGDFSIDFQAYYANAWNGGQTGPLDSATNNSKSWLAMSVEPGAGTNAPLGSVKAYPANQLQFNSPYPAISSFKKIMSYAHGLSPQGTEATAHNIIYEEAWDIYGFAHTAESQTTLEVMFWLYNHNQDPSSIGPMIESGLDISGDGILWDLYMTPDTAATGGINNQYSYGIFYRQPQFQEAAGWVDILAGLRYFCQYYVKPDGPGAPATPLDIPLWQITHGWEVCSTDYSPLPFRLLDYHLDIA